jgi:hypothetical protein
LNGTNQLLACADDLNVLGHNINTIKKNIETSIDSGKQVDEEINVEKTKHMLLSCHHNGAQNREKDSNHTL